MNTNVEESADAAKTVASLRLALGRCQRQLDECQKRMEQMEQGQPLTKRSEDHLRLVLDTIPGLVWSAKPDGHIEYLNRRWIEYTGLALEEAGGWGWQAAVHPDELPGLVDYWKSILASGQAGETEARLRRFDGTYRWFLFRGVPLHDECGNLIKWYGTNTDIEDRKWAEALLAGEKSVLEMIANGNPLPSILEALCRLVEELSSGSLCSILLLDPNCHRLWHGAAPSLPASYAKAIDGSAIGPSTGPCARAALFKEPVIISDIAADPLAGDFRQLALAHGLRACWSTPILSSDGRVLGTFAIYSRQPRSPDRQDHRITGQFTHLAAVAIERKRAEDKLRRSESSLARAQRLSVTGSFSWHEASGEMTWSDETYRICEIDPAVKPTAEMTRDLIHPEDVALFRQMLVGGEKDFRFDCRLRLPGGSIKHLKVAANALRDDSGQVTEWVGAVQDVTECVKSEEALRASEHLARGQLEALKNSLDSLTQESGPDKFLEHVLRTITEQLDAHSSSVWRREDGNGLVSFQCAFEGGRLMSKSNASIAAISPSLPIQAIWPWPEVFESGKPSVLEDIRAGPVFPWREHLMAQGVITILIVPMAIAGQIDGVIGIRFTRKRIFRAEEMELAQALAHQAMLAMQLTRLSSQSRQAAVMAERNRMARDIHDTLAQGFTGVIVQLEAAADAKSQGLSREADDHLRRASELARDNLKEARRSVRALRPQALEDKNLCEALEDLSRKMTDGTTMRAKFTLQGQPRPLPAEWEGNILRIGQEVLTNALRHAHASEFKTELVFAPEEIRLELRDNGRGFDPDSKYDGFGLVGMRERVEGMGGQITLESANGAGTAILIALPLKNNLEAPES